MISREHILDFIRDDDLLNTLSINDRYEIMIACCSHSDFLGQLVEKSIDREDARNN